MLVDTPFSILYLTSASTVFRLDDVDLVFTYFFRVNPQGFTSRFQCQVYDTFWHGDSYLPGW
jgi:hypothetical protein